MKTQATRMTRKQLEYLRHWKAKGYEYRPGDEVPEDITQRPPALERVGVKELVTSIVILCLVLAAAAGGLL